jgi:hypothetical protein
MFVNFLKLTFSIIHGIKEITEREERKRVEEIRAKEEDQKRLLQEEEGRKVNEKIRLEKEERKRRELEEYNKVGILLNYVTFTVCILS